MKPFHPPPRFPLPPEATNSLFPSFAKQSNFPPPTPRDLLRENTSSSNLFFNENICSLSFFFFFFSRGKQMRKNFVPGLIPRMRLRLVG